MTSHTLHL